MLWRNPKVHYRVQKSQQVDLMLFQLNSVQVFITHSSKFCSKSILPSGLLPWEFSTKNSVSFLLSSVGVTCTSDLMSFPFNNLPIQAKITNCVTFPYIIFSSILLLYLSLSPIILHRGLFWNTLELVLSCLVLSWNKRSRFMQHKIKRALYLILFGRAPSHLAGQEICGTWRLITLFAELATATYRDTV